MGSFETYFSLFEIIKSYFFNNLNVILYGFFAYLIGVVQGRLKGFLGARKVRGILKLKKSDVELILPVREGKITRNKRKTSPQNKYVTLKEVEVLLEIKKLLAMLKKPLDNISIIDDTCCTSPKRDLFYIGGAFANEGVLTILVNHFPGFKIACSVESYEQYINLRPLLVPNTKNDYKRWLVYNDKEILPFDSRTQSYIILGRLSGKAHFGDSNRGTTQVLFGSDAVATLAAVKCITEHRNELYSRIKNKKELSLVAFLCSKRGEIDFNTFYDIV